MICQTCQRFSTNRVLCDTCRKALRPGRERILPGGVRLIAAFEHAGPARDLVHHLKYRGVAGYADIVARQLARLVPDAALVPIPRSLTRRLKYGVDPARVIAERIGALKGNLIIPALAAPVHAPRRAGNDHSRVVAPFRLRFPIKVKVVIVDDVVTTGATVQRAIEAIGSDNVSMVVAANAADRVSSLPSGRPI